MLSPCYWKATWLYHLNTDITACEMPVTRELPHAKIIPMPAGGPILAFAPAFPPATRSHSKDALVTPNLPIAKHALAAQIEEH
ncbi:MAG: hypothetical protein KA287_05410, partial [Rhodoferax sp.]|nr:hypothetical protein [Rhodoferax sp.]